MAAFTNTAAFATEAAVGIGTDLARFITGDAARVSLIVGSQAVLTFDATISEQYQQDVEPTAFPLEDGSVVTDHLVVAPLEIAVAGVISDDPVGRGPNLITESLQSSINALAGPFGVVAANTALAAITALRGATSPSRRALDTLYRLTAGDPANNTGPVLVDVMANRRRYPSMAIKSLQVPRDASTGTRTLVFNVTLRQVRTVRSQATTLLQLKSPAVGQSKSATTDATAQAEAALGTGPTGAGATDVAAGEGSPSAKAAAVAARYRAGNQKAINIVNGGGF